VKYTPVSEGSDNGTVTLTGGIHTKTITVSGTSINCTVDALPYQETFTGTLDCWTLVDADQDGLNWGLGEGYAASESFYFIFALTPDNWMISPALPVPAQGPTSVSWEVTVADPDFSAEHYGLFISTNRDDLQSYTSLFEETLTSDEVDWTSREVTLPESYAGQTVYIAFRHFDCTDQSLMALRNVEVASTVGISSLPAQVTHIYPNPATDRVNVSTKLCQTAEVIDMMGRTVITVKPNNTQFEINVAGLKSGLYAIRLTHEGGISTSKFIKR
jgi:hypothetical protein